MVFTSDEMAEVRRISEQVLMEHIGRMFLDRQKDENNLIVISKEFRGSNAEQMELDINDWLKSTGTQEIHKIDSIKDPLSSMGVIKTVFARVKRGTTLGASADAANPPKNN